jgi:GMP synthase-like glutamine amidotransferase
LISGSKHGAYEDHAFIPPLSDLIREIYASARPMVGICFGHQIIAQALGGHVEKFEGGWAIGRHDYSFNGHGSVTLNAWHQDQVTALPPEAQVIGSSPFCQFAALLYGEKAFTVQPHPEFSNPVFDDYVKSRRSSPAYPAAVMQRADQLRHVPIQNSAIAADIAAFLKGEYRAEISS